jgi:hypothetical protein
VRLGRRQEDVDLVEPVAPAQRILQPALVRDQDGERDAVRRIYRRQHLAGIGKLRDHVGADEARDLQPAQPRARQEVDQPHLVGGRDHLGLVLEAVARPHLADPDGGLCHGPGI